MISREAGLNDTASKCTGVPSYEDCIDTSMSSRIDLIVKGNQVFVGSTVSGRLQYGQIWNPSSVCEEDKEFQIKQIWMSIDNENEEVN